MASPRTKSLLGLAAAAATLATAAPSQAAPTVAPAAADTTPPTLALRLTKTYRVGQCFWGPDPKFAAESRIDLDETSWVEVRAVQTGVTRTANINRGAGINLFFSLPIELIGSKPVPVALTITPVDLAGNRGASTALTLPVYNNGLSYFC